MSILIPILYVIEISVCLLLAMVVMLQKPKEGGLGGAIAGGMLESSLGADAGNVLIKATAILGIVFLANTLLLAKLTAAGTRSVVQGETPSPVEQTPALPQLPVEATPAPQAPAAPQSPADAK